MLTVSGVVTHGRRVGVRNLTCGLMSSGGVDAHAIANATGLLQVPRVQQVQPTRGPVVTISAQICRHVSSITPRSEDFTAWYGDVIAGADMVDSSPVRGCSILKPHGYAVWERLRDALDLKIRETGHENVYFPMLVPESYLAREAEHIEGFAKECAVVTHTRLHTNPETGALEPDPESELAERYVIRPTSETVIWDAYSRWIHSHRDLPLLYNQWANVMRWEMRTRPFLRTSEFLWQEGHTAHATSLEAEQEARTMLGVYEEVCRDVLAVAVVPGEKSPSERFAGAVATHTIEAMMQNGFALQSGTSHFLGQNFAKAFNVTFLDEQGDRNHVWATSWGVSTRLIGALIMSHSDDKGLVLPPPVAPVQVVVVPILGRNAEASSSCIEAGRQLVAQFTEIGVRAQLDGREHVQTGAKFFEWEKKGVPIRIEIGPRDMKKNQVVVQERWSGEKQALPLDGALAGFVSSRLDHIHSVLLNASEERLRANTHRVSKYEEMRDAMAGVQASDFPGAGFFLAPWCDDADNEAAIKADCKATIRCFPHTHQDELHAQGPQVCFYSGKPATHMAIFARAY